jgi:hypothetical protein
VSVPKSSGRGLTKHPTTTSNPKTVSQADDNQPPEAKFPEFPSILENSKTVTTANNNDY